MNCIGPITPDDIELLAYADNASSAAVQEHLAACQTCRGRAFQLSREQRRLQSVLARAGCPTATALGEYYLGLAGEQAAGEVTGHLALCPACRAELADLAAFMKQLRRPLAEAAEDAAGSLRTVVGRLSFGPIGGPSLAPALRGPGDSEAAPVVYEAEDVLVTVDSWIERLGQAGRVVAGLVVGPVDFAGAEAVLDAAGSSSRTAINELGNFRLPEVTPGTHRLVIRLPSTGLQIEIDELVVK